MIYRLNESLWLNVEATLHTFGGWTCQHKDGPAVLVIDVHRLVDLLSRLHAAETAANVEFEVPAEAAGWLSNDHRRANAFHWGDVRVLVLAHGVDFDISTSEPPAHVVWQAHFEGAS